MPADYYPEVADEAPAKGAASEPMPDETGENTEAKPAEKEGEEPESTLVPLTAFSGEVKAGDTGTFTVVHVYEDEVEVSLKGGEPKREKSQKPSEMPAGDELDLLAKE